MLRANGALRISVPACPGKCQDVVLSARSFEARKVIRTRLAFPGQRLVEILELQPKSNLRNLRPSPCNTCKRSAVKSLNLLQTAPCSVVLLTRGSPHLLPRVSATPPGAEPSSYPVPAMLGESTDKVGCADVDGPSRGLVLPKNPPGSFHVQGGSRSRSHSCTNIQVANYAQGSDSEPTDSSQSLRRVSKEEELPSSSSSSWSLFSLLGSNPFKDLPDRYLTVAKTSLAFVLASMDKVNLSVAIIPMAQEFSWNATTAGLVQSAFFWGYAASLIPSGWLAQRFTGQRVLRAGVASWSLFTAVAPWCTGSLPLLLLSRVLVGFGEGIAPPAATDLVARTMPASERTRAVSTVFNGFNVGSVLGLLISPWLIQAFGWESVFYFFGLAGLLWCAGFNPPPPGEDVVAQTELASASAEKTANKLVHGGVRDDLVSVGGGKEDLRIPWRAILSRRSVWALLYIHLCNNWGHFCVPAWLPTFYNQGLHLDLGQSALVSVAPPLLSILVSVAVAPLADRFVQRGTEVTLVRKVAQGAAFLVPALCMILVSAAPELGLPPWAVIVLLSLGLGFTACAYAGLYCAHQDMSKKYASILLGLSTTVGAIPGILGVPLTGYLFDHTQSWVLSLFLPSVLFYFTGTAVWILYGDCRPQHFEDELEPLLEHSTQKSKWPLAKDDDCE